MAMVCPQCATSHQQRLQCPECGVRLLFHQPGRGKAGSAWNRSRWIHTGWGRVVVGVAFAEGLFLAIRQVLTGVLMLTAGESAGDPWAGVAGQLCLQVLQVVTPALGGIVAAAGMRNGWLLGTFVGLGDGVVALLLPGPVLAPSLVAVYALPLVKGLFGALGALVGATLWKPPQPWSMVGAEKKDGLGRRASPLFAGPVRWFRVALGSATAVTGNLFAARIFQAVLDAGQGTLETTHVRQDQILTWEIRAFAILFGAALAGATTSNGMKQGLFVGLFAGFALAAVPANHATWTLLCLTMASCFFLSLAGGWFGCQLLPPIVKKSRLARRYGSAAV